jgi:hypothetical protein
LGDRNSPQRTDDTSTSDFSHSDSRLLIS